MIARVLQIGGGIYRVRAGGLEFDCSLRGKLKLADGGSVAVGDRVEIEELDDGSRRIVGIVPRTSSLTRRAISRRKDQVMAANVDLVAAVVAAARPDPDLYMLDRLLAVAELEEITAFIVLNKMDLLGTETSAGASVGAPAEAAVGAPVQAADIPPELADYRSIGYDLLPVSTKAGLGLEDLRSTLAGRTTVLAGASGVGKSSLLNALMPGLSLRVGEVGDRSGRGKHTTTTARLIPLDDESYIADTPGIQHFMPARAEVSSLGFAFREFRPYLETCRFADCRHREEPGCAVLGAIEDGEILGRRHESYLKLLAEAEELEERTRTRGGGGG
ncbi:MAG: ribosome small subunit-dependent GTPase A [Gemmatimonadota bacterium]